MSYEEIPYHEHYDLDRGVRDVQQELWTAQEARDQGWPRHRQARGGVGTATSWAHLS
jgi:hypothetical protein